MISIKYPFFRIPLFFQNKINAFLSTIFLSTAFFLYSCEEEPGFIGLEIQPRADKLSVKFAPFNEVSAFTFEIDSVEADKYHIQLLGEIDDPVFGRSRSDFFSQMVMSAYGVNFGINPVVDSMFLYLRLNGFYGANPAPINLKVYELTDTIYFDSVYYSNINPAEFHNPGAMIGNLVYSPSPNDTIVKIHITSELFKTKLITADSASRANDINFRNFFKGLYVTAEMQSNPGAILSVNLNSIHSRISMHYRNDADTLEYKYFFGNFVTKVNLFRHNRTSTVFYPRLNQTTIQDSVVYVQSMSGLSARLLFPNLISWRDSVPVSINRAKLVLPVEQLDATASNFPRPESLILLSKDPDGNFSVISDFNIGEAYFGGNYNPDTNSYNFNITNQVQQFINRRIENLDLYLMVSDIATTPNRVVLTSGNHSNPIRLEITYQRF